MQFIDVFHYFVFWVGDPWRFHVVKYLALITQEHIGESAEIKAPSWLKAAQFHQSEQDLN